MENFFHKSYRNTWISFLLTLVIFIVLVREIAVTVIDVPFWDEWNWVHLFEDTYDGSLRLSDLWEPYGVHRNVFPRLSMLGLGYLTHWDIRIEVIVNGLMAIATFWIVLTMLRRLFPVRSNAFAVLMPIIALLMFSLTQYENWVIGGNTVMFMTVLCVTLGTLFVSQPTFSHRHVLAALLCGIVATYSCGLGPAFWISGAYGLYGNTMPGKIRIRYVAVWVFVIVLALYFYLMGISAIPDAGRYISIEHVVNALRYVLIYIGRPISSMTFSHTDLMELAGAAGIIGASTMIVLLKRYYGTHWKKVLPFVSLMGFVLVNAIITSGGRSSMGIEQAGSSRYTAISALYWISWVTLAVFLIRSFVQEQRYARAITGCFTVCAVVILSLWGSVRSQKEFQSFNTRFLIGREKLLRGETCIHELFGESVQCRPREIEILKRYRLSVFRFE